MHEYGVYVVYVWCMRGACVVHMWFTCGACVVYLWCMCGVCVVCVWCMCGVCGVCVVRLRNHESEIKPFGMLQLCYTVSHVCTINELAGPEIKVYCKIRYNIDFS